jgi:hypothetical protein
VRNAAFQTYAMESLSFLSSFGAERWKAGSSRR